MTKTSCVGRTEPALGRYTTQELMTLLQHAEQSRAQIGAFIGRVDAELRGRGSGSPQPAA